MEVYEGWIWIAPVRFLIGKLFHFHKRPSLYTFGRSAHIETTSHNMVCLFSLSRSRQKEFEMHLEIWDAPLVSVGVLEVEMRRDLGHCEIRQVWTRAQVVPMMSKSQRNVFVIAEFAKTVEEASRASMHELRRSTSVGTSECNLTNWSDFVPAMITVYQCELHQLMLI